MDFRSSLRVSELASLASAAALAVTLGLGFTSTAKADMPEYWERETFHTSKPTTASFFEEQARERGEYRAKRKYAPKASRLGGPVGDEDFDDDDAPRRVKRPRVTRKTSSNRVASLGDASETKKERRASKSLSGGGGVTWHASASCLDSSLRSVIATVAARYGSVTVNSTCRSRGHNRSVGGAPHSKHLTGDAVDFRVRGNIGATASYLRSLGGGYKHYGGGLFHIDNGPKRTW
ncbi:MAG: D-Ala-D-Ala carboxypeptidase family metallohydrolase [Hyphomicrobiaceae bacterium]